MFDASHCVACYATVQAPIIGPNVCDIQMTYNIAGTIDVLTDCVSMQRRHFNYWLRIEQPRELERNNGRNVCIDRNDISEIEIFTCGGGEPVAMHLNDIC